MIARCCQLKAEVVRLDEREERGMRAVLNYGHTFAHAFETLAGYGKLLHGEAVAIGMDCAARLAEQLGRVDGGFRAAAAGAARIARPLAAIAEDRPRAGRRGDDARQEGRARPAAAGPSRPPRTRRVGFGCLADVVQEAMEG